MGDERYYTYGQFINIIFLMLLVVFSTGSYMFSYYKNREDFKNKLLSHVFFQIILLSLLRFVEEVSLSLEIAVFCRQGEGILFFCVLSTSYQYLKGILGKADRKIYRKRVFYAYGVSVFGVLLMEVVNSLIGEGGFLFLKEYSFSTPSYANGYPTILFLFFLLLTISCKALLSKQNKMAEMGSYRLSVIGYAIFAMFLFPGVLYCILLFSKRGSTNTVEILLYFFICILYDIIIATVTPYNITSIAFDNTKDFIQNGIVLLDERGKLIYRNSFLEKRELFSNKKNFPENKITDFFAAEEVQLITKHQRGCIQVKNKEQIYYFSYNQKEIGSEKKGKLFLFTDITNLILMLDKVVEEREKIKVLNQELKDYAQVVFELEKEKQVQELLFQVNSIQEKNIHQLNAQISGIWLKEDDEIEEELEKAIEAVNTTLNDVRKAVNLYKSYYGGLR